MSRTLWRPCCKTYRRFLHKKERGLPAFRWQTSWRRWRDSNSRAGFEPTYRISSADPSTAWVHLQIYVISLVPTRRPIQPVEIGKNNRIEQTPIHNLNLPANPHGYWLFGSLDFQSGNMISRVAPSTTRTTLQVVSSPNPLWKMGRTDGENSKIFSFSNPRKPA